MKYLKYLAGALLIALLFQLYGFGQTANGVGASGASATSTAAATAGTVTTVSVTTANGVSGVVATATTTPAITITLGAITPTTINSTSTSKLGSAGVVFTNIRHGITGALSGGTLVVADAGSTANTRYFFSAHTLGTVTVTSAYFCSARNAGVSFTVTASVPTDTSTVDWMAVEP